MIFFPWVIEESTVFTRCHWDTIARLSPPSMQGSSVQSVFSTCDLTDLKASITMSWVFQQMQPQKLIENDTSKASR